MKYYAVICNTRDDIEELRDLVVEFSGEDDLKFFLDYNVTFPYYVRLNERGEHIGWGQDLSYFDRNHKDHTKISISELKVVLMMKDKIFKIGDKVKVVKRVEKELGWWNHWVSLMDKTIGLEFEITAISTAGVSLAGTCCSYPPSSLELVTKKEEEPSLEDMVKYLESTGKYAYHDAIKVNYFIEKAQEEKVQRLSELTEKYIDIDMSEIEEYKRLKAEFEGEKK